MTEEFNKSMRMRIYFFIGTTAEFIKLAPVIREFKRRKIFFKILTSGQNNVNFSELSFFTGPLSVYYAFRMKPITLAFHPIIKFVIWTVKAFVNYMLFFRHEFKTSTRSNTVFIVHGDTISSLLGAVIAKFFRVTVVHIESGLRSFNYFEPFPEEICRYIVSRIADIHFCPNDWCVGNLAGVSGLKINTFENTLIESFWAVMKKRSKTDILKQIHRIGKKYYVLVVHRQEHVMFNRMDMRKLVHNIFEFVPKSFHCVLIVHDLSKAFMKKTAGDMSDVQKQKVLFTSRLTYHDFMHVIHGSEFIVSDGGSNQEEMYYMGKPCLVLRNVTERIEGIGRNAILAKSDLTVIRGFVNSYRKYRQKPVPIKQRPSEIIVNNLQKGELFK